MPFTKPVIIHTIKKEINGCSLTTVISSTRKTTANNSNKSVMS